MSRFLSKFVLEREIGGNRWVLAEELRYYSELFKTPGRWPGDIQVPKGFVTDFASIPRFFHRLLPQNGEYDAPAVVHDFLYATAPCDKAAADLVFLEAMESIGVSWWKRTAMYQAVKWFGFVAWNNHRRQQEQRERQDLVDVPIGSPDI